MVFVVKQMLLETVEKAENVVQYVFFDKFIKFEKNEK